MRERERERVQHWDKISERKKKTQPSSLAPSTSNDKIEKKNQKQSDKSTKRHNEITSRATTARPTPHRNIRPRLKKKKETANIVLLYIVEVIYYRLIIKTSYWVRSMNDRECTERTRCTCFSFWSVLFCCTVAAGHREVRKATPSDELVLWSPTLFSLCLLLLCFFIVAQCCSYEAMCSAWEWVRNGARV